MLIVRFFSIVIELLKLQIELNDPQPHHFDLLLVVIDPAEGVEPIFIDRKDTSMPATITDVQKVTAILRPKNAKGNPAQIDGVPVWESSNPAVATVTPAPDGLSAVLTAVTPGVTQITARADADLDVGETREITITDTVTVAASEATTLGIEFGTPEAA